MVVNERLNENSKIIRRYITKGGHSVVVVEFNEPNEQSYMVTVEQDISSKTLFTTFHKSKSDAIQMAQFNQYSIEKNMED